MTLNTSLPKSNIISKPHTPSSSLTLDLRKQFEEKKEKDGEQKESDSKNRIDNKDRINENLQLFKEKKKEVNL